MTTPIPVSPTVTGESYASDLTTLAGTPWEGVLVVEGIETGDGREFAANALTWADLPIPLRRNIEESHGGEPSSKTVLVGRIDSVWRSADNPLEIRGSGIFDDQGEHGAEALRLVRSGFLKGVSVDPDDIKNPDIEYVFANEDDAPSDDIMNLFQEPSKTVFHAGRLRAATLVDIPAFVEAQIWLVDPATVQPTTVVASSQPWNGALYERRIRPGDGAAIRAAFAHVDTDGAQLTAKFLHHEIGEDGVVGAPSLAACAAAARYLTSDRAAGMSIGERRRAYAHIVEHLAAAGHTVDDVARLLEGPIEQPLIAALETLEGPPAEWFSFAEPDRWVPPHVSDTVTAAGWRQFYGHGAAWGTCHTGFAGVCKEPPREGEHSFFRTGEVLCADGSRVAVGSVTLGLGHAPTVGVPAMRAVEHYDNTEAVVALVASSEGKHGIWLAGAIPPWVSAERAAKLQASGQLSGDWRGIGGKLRLVAFLAVNHPGFPIPRLTAGVSGGRQVSLVAAGLRPEPPDLSSVTHRVAKSIGRDPASRAAEIRRRVKGV